VAGRRTFFSFHYKRDIWRVANIRKSGQFDAQAAAGWKDASLWETNKSLGDPFIKRAITEGLKNTSVTVVLIGAATSKRDWVDYEIRKSHERGNGVIGVRIHNLRDQNGKADARGAIPQRLLDSKAPIYDYDSKLLGSWIEKSAIAAGHPCLAHGTKQCVSCRLSILIHST
jgi:hypothetical protein